MCGRFALSDTHQLSLRFDVEPGDESSLIPRYNVAPTQSIPVIVEENGGRVLRMMRWGFRPAWKQPAGGAPDPINARAETLMERPMFRPSVVKRRCLIPANGFYEWKAQPGSKLKQPYYIHLKDNGLFAFAGIYVDGRDAGGSPEQTCAIITTGPNELMSEIHNRMPAILEPRGEQAWIDSELTEPEVVLPLLRPYEAGDLQAYPVPPRVSSARNEGPELADPVE